MTGFERMPTANLVIALQNIAKDVSHMTPRERSRLLEEAARRLSAYRQEERAREMDQAMGRHGR